MELYYQDLRCKRAVKVSEASMYSNFYGPTPEEWEWVDDEMDFTYYVSDEKVMQLIIKLITEREIDDISAKEYEIIYWYVATHIDDLFEEYEDYIKDYFEEDASEEASKDNY